MKKSFFLVVAFIFVLHPAALAVSKPHVITFGKWTTVKCVARDSESSVDVRVRGLYIDTRLKEYTSGPAHEVTDRLFVVRRVFRVNDSLPQENVAAARWIWQLGGWLMVDRATGRISQLALPEFDASVSEIAWYRDYVAYCGFSDDGKSVFAMIMQLGRRKPVLKKALAIAASDNPDPGCSTPEWQRLPIRVTFGLSNNQKLNYSVRGNALSVVSDAEDEAD